MDFDNILTYEKSHKSYLIYGISYKTLIGTKTLRIRFDKIDWFIRTDYLWWNYIFIIVGSVNIMALTIELDGS